MGKEFRPENTRKVPFLRGILTPVFHSFFSKISKWEFMPIISEEMGITSEEIPIYSEEIIIIGERIPPNFGRNTLYWGRNRYKWGNNSGNEKAERNARLLSKCRRK